MIKPNQLKVQGEKKGTKKSFTCYTVHSIFGGSYYLCGPAILRESVVAHSAQSLFTGLLPHLCGDLANVSLSLVMLWLSLKRIRDIKG